MSSISNINFTNFQQKELESSDLKSNEIVDDSLRDLSIGIILTGSACAFAASPHVFISLIAYTVAALSISTFFRISAHILEQNKMNKGAKVCRIVAPYNMALIYGTTGNVLVHEMGHAAAISLVFKSGQPQITIHGFFTGSTSWIYGKYTKLGKFLGPLHAQIFITAAGPLAAIALATIGIILALKLGQDSYLGKCALFSSLFSIIHHVDYALSAFLVDPENLGHDFLMLWYCGIHPLVSVVCMIAIPVIAVIGYSYFNQKSSTESKLLLPQ